ncbi:uncharacterized protein LOC143181221 [Calliopsis andreniformis]|uniref:uncharacterized protein LOC143181221 n=1 Tax=Calliopsis andreniformis TaxID=337506 RepID=UPI003FCE8FE8
MSALIWQITAFLLLVHRSLCVSDPIALQTDKQSGSSLLNNVEKKISSDRVIFDDEKRSKEGSTSRNSGQLGFNERKQDEQRYDDQDRASKGYDKGRHSLGESEAIDQGKNSFERHGGGYYKKGHHRTGFSNNYHKDESGNNSSFYEDSDDERGHRSSGNTGGYYGQKSRDSFRDGAHDLSYSEHDRAQQRMYDNRQKFNDYRDHSGGYHNDRYRDDRRNYLKDEAGRYFGRNGKEIYYHKEKLNPIIHRSNYLPLFSDPRYEIDTISRGYYKQEPYVVPYLKDHRYFPNQLRGYERELYYPHHEDYGRNYRDDLYDNEYVKHYRRGFNGGYHRF